MKSIDHGKDSKKPLRSILFVVHILFPDVLLLLTVFVSAHVMFSLHGKATANLNEEDVNFCNCITVLAFVNVAIMVPYLAVNVILLYIDKVFNVYNFSDKMFENLSHASRITEKFKNFNLCITFFILLFSSKFRSALCSAK